MPSKRDNPLSRLTSDEVIIFGHLLEGSQRLVSSVEADLRAETGKTVSEMEVLIRLANSENSQLRPKELADQCVMSTSGCTRLLDRLEQEKLVARRAHGTDRRGLVVELTKDGKQLLQTALPQHYKSLDAHLWSVLSDSEMQQLSKIMAKIRDANS